MQFAVLVASPPDYIHNQAWCEVAETLNIAITQLGYSCCITNRILPDCRHIVLGAYLLPRFPVVLPDDSILYNLEQINFGKISVINDQVIEIFQKYTLWDYSSKNCLELALRGCMHVQHVPLGYVPQLTRICQLPESAKDIDILFYGSLTPKRLKILDGLSNSGINVVKLFGIYGEERDSIIARSKIILNLHHDYGDIFEIVRVSYLLANNAFVISEECYDDPDAESLKDGIVFASYDNLIEKCLHFLQLPQERQLVAGKGFELISQRPEVDYLRKALEGSNQAIKNLVRVDLGCGRNKFPGYIGVDIYPAEGVDIVANLASHFPFEDNTIDFVRAYDFIEHVPDRINTMNEIWRTCKNGALVNLLVPSTDGRGAFQDPTHVSFWNLNSFCYFTVENPGYLALCQQYGFKGAFSLVVLRQYESSNKVIHVHALLRVLKADVNDSFYLPQKPVYIIVLPDWKQNLEVIYNDLKNVLTKLTEHTNSNSIALLIDVSTHENKIEPSPQDFLLDIILKLLLDENIDLNDHGIEIAFINCLDSHIWNQIKARIGYHLIISHESSIRHNIQNQPTIKSIDANDFADIDLVLKFGLSELQFSWLKNQISDPRIEIGDFTYCTGEIDWQINSPEARIQIGKFCSIASNVSIYGGTELCVQRTSNYPFHEIFAQQANIEPCMETIVRKMTKIGHDVLVGEGVTICSGVNIGTGSIIATKAVVVQDIPPYAIVSGNPAKVIGYRFNPEIIQFLLELKWWEWALEKILLNLHILYKNPEEWYKNSAQLSREYPNLTGE